MAVTSITVKEGATISPRVIDFVTQFQRDWEAYNKILGILRPIKKNPGSELRVKSVKVNLNKTQVEKGEKINLTTFELDEKPVGNMTIEKYRTQVPIEDIEQYGYELACARTDEEFRAELKSDVTDRFYTFLKNHAKLKGQQKTWKASLAIAKGAVENRFKAMHKTVTEVVGFANIMDAYQYLADAELTVQTAFGINYVENFLGYRTLFLLSDTEMPQGKVIAVPRNNIVEYYTDPGDSNYAKAELVYYVNGDTNLIGFATRGDYDTASSMGYAIMGLHLMVEYEDGICLVEVKPSADPALPTVPAEPAEPAEPEGT